MKYSNSECFENTFNLLEKNVIQAGSHVLQNISANAHYLDMSIILEDGVGRRRNATVGPGCRPEGLISRSWKTASAPLIHLFKCI